ncbi:MAG: sodium:calcium antiporter [Burkholderiaceae bacterium]|nr:sodium:calcium antiporter [Burkholderiaceae bacterium]
MSSLWVHWLQLALCAALILVAGTRLSRYGDVIARHTGLGGGWIGLVLMASVTSLPELVTGIASVTVADVPDIAVGNVLGACVLNLAMMVVLDALHRHASIYQVASQGHTLGAAFGIVMLGVVAFGMLAAPALDLRVGHVGLVTPALLALYLVAIRTIYQYERGAAALAAAAATAVEPAPEMTLRQAAVRYAVAAAVVVGAALWLPFVAGDLAAAMGWTDSFVGTLLVAVTTTLPELTVTIASVRIGALDMAIGNLVGSNLFNLAILGIDDLVYLDGPLLAAAAPAHALSAVSAAVMSGALIVALVARPQARLLNFVGWTSVALALIYFANAWMHFRQPI